jgi:hypothetical protein
VGAFYLIAHSDPRQRLRLTQRAEASLRLQGWTEPLSIETSTAIVGLYKKQVASTPNCVALTDGDFCACVGTLFYQGLYGAAALRRLHQDFNGELPDPSTLHGAFFVLLRKGGAISLFGDPLGLYKVYCSDNGQFASSSFLAAAATAERVTPCDQGVYEYVFQGATFGRQTVLQEVRLLPTWICHSASAAGLKAGASFGLPKPEIRNAPLDEHVEALHARVDEVFASVTRAFGEQISIGLSGGFDSRLMLAALLARSTTPAIHVYGRAHDEDVRVALQIAAGEPLHVEHVDKSARAAPMPEQWSDVVERNFLGFDGVAADGVFDSGSDLATRLERCAEGRMQLNGGGGEIMRNFYYLPEGRYSAREVLWTFFSAYDPRSCRARFDERTYLDCLEEKLNWSLQRDASKLERPEVELTYPYFRCRFWTGRNNSINNRFGPDLTPFLDFELVRRAVHVPLAYKTFGAAEARLIARFSPRLARYPSVYGSPLDQPPSFARRLSVAATYYRPPRLRRLIFRIRNRLRDGADHSAVRAAVEAGVLDGRMPRMSQWFDISRIADPGQIARVATLEYLFGRLDAH